MNPLDLSPAEFQDFLTEERQYRSPEQIDDLIRRYNAANSLSGRLAGLLEPKDGRRRTSILPASVPEGMSLMEALQSGEAEFAIPQGIVDMVTGTVRGVENPALAAQGRIPASDINAAGFETAASAMGLGGLLATKPAGSLGAFYGREGGSVQDALELAKSGRGIFHSSQADQFDEINKYGVEPQYGPWVKEIAEGATDDPSFLDDMPMAAWWSEQPDWVKIKTARAAGKSVNDVTVDDIRKYGHLSIADADEYADTVYRIPEEGIEYEGSDISNLSGERMPLYATDLYEYGNDGVGRYPFGIERNELVTRESVEPKYSLTGQELVDFLEQYDGNAVSANASKSAGAAATTVAELRRQANIQRFGYDPNEPPEVDTSYRISHQPSGPKDENPIRLDNLTKTVTGETAGYPEDFYGNQGARIYAPPRSFADDEYGIANEESYDVIRNVRNNPDAEVTIYRAVPDSDDINTINEGDWITLSPKYAEVHAASGYGRSGDEAGKVISQKVKVKDIYWAGDDVNEFGYFPDTTAANASKTVGFFGMFGGKEIKPKPEVRNLFSEDVYHYMNTNKMEGDVFDSSKSFSRLDRLGPHVGTAKAAEDRYHAFYARSPELVKDYLNLTQSSTGMTMPLKARVDRPFLNEQGQPFQESELLDVMNKYADDNNIKDLDVAAAQFRKDLTDAGFTNVPYVNAIEDRGSISHIMLTGRTAGDPEVLRSRFARFQDPYDESIIAANASALGGLLTQSLSEKQANKIEDYLYRTGLLQ